MKLEKGKQGYIKQRKKVDLIWLLAFIALGIGIFLTGYFVTKTRANIFTVLAVLMVLPGAKRIVALFVLMPRKSVSKERYDKVKEAIGEATMYTDYVFTSTEKIMHLDFLVVKNGNVLGVIAPSKQDTDYLKTYLKETVKKSCSNYHVKFFNKEEDMLQYVLRMSKREREEQQEKALIELLYASIV